MKTLAKALLIGGVVLGSPVSMASVIGAGSFGGFDDVKTVAIGGSSVGFGGVIGDHVGETEDNILVHLMGSQGTATATSFVVNSPSVNGNGTLGLYSWDGALATLIASVTGAVNTSLTLSAFLTGGDYVLKISGPGNSGYGGDISAVPLPGAAVLFGTALLGAGALRRKNKAKTNSLAAA